MNDRLTALDQFRGYTVFGMFLVNFVGGYKNVPTTLGHHHTYCSYADTIMPQFLFAVGMAMRLTFLKRRSSDGPAAPYGKAIKRGLGLFLLGIVLYHLTGGFKTWNDVQNTDWSKFFVELFKRGPFETLTHIAVATLFVLPVIAAGPRVRFAYAIAAGAAHILISLVWYYQWNLTSPVGIDGGPLGFLSWSVPLLFGTLAYDWYVAARQANRSPVVRFLLVGVVVMAVAYGLSCLNRYTEPNAAISTDSAGVRLADPPFTPLSEPWQKNYWIMSQRAGSVTYTLFGAGFSFVIFALFVIGSESAGLVVPIFDLFGRNALGGYIVHMLAMDAVKPFVPRDAPGWYVWCGFAVYLGICWLFIRYLDRNKLYLRL